MANWHKYLCLCVLCGKFLFLGHWMLTTESTEVTENKMQKKTLCAKDRLFFCGFCASCGKNSSATKGTRHAKRPIRPPRNISVIRWLRRI